MREASAIFGKRIKTPEARQRVALANLCAEVAEELVAARERAGLSQAELAKMIKTSQSAIARVEDADYEGHSLRTIARIASALGLRVSVRLEDEGSPRKAG